MLVFVMESQQYFLLHLRNICKVLLCDRHCGANIIETIYHNPMRNLSKLSNPYFPRLFYSLSNESTLCFQLPSILFICRLGCKFLNFLGSLSLSVQYH